VTKQPATADANRVNLRGRVSGAPAERLMRSGDRLVTLRLVVPRPRSRSRPGATVDTFDCVAWAAKVGDALLGLAPDDQVEVSGALRRRFWRGEGAAMSRVEVEISRVRRLRRPP